MALLSRVPLSLRPGRLFLSEPPKTCHYKVRNLYDSRKKCLSSWLYSDVSVTYVNRKRVADSGASSRSSCRAYASAAVSGNMSLEKIQIVRNGDGEVTFDAYVIGPVGAPGVVVIQEWWGVDYEIKNHATYLAGKGYRALIPDLYRGKVALEQAEAQHYLHELDWPGAVKDIAASAKWLKEHGSPKVGVTGFCMGGALTVASAVLVDDVSAAAAFYGVPPLQLADPAKAKVPLQGHFGESDPMKGFSDPEAAHALEAKLKEAGVDNEVYIYPGQGHAFMNASEAGIERKVGQGNPPHDQTAVDLAWSRVEAWFGKYLK